MTGQPSEQAGQEQSHAHAAHGPGHVHGHGHHGHHKVNGHAKATININSKKGHGHHNNHAHNHHHNNNNGNHAANNHSAPPEHRMSSSSGGLSNDHFQIPIKRVDPPKSREQKFQSVSMKELLAKCNLPPPVTLEPHTCVEKALKVLSEHRILSAPVTDPMGKMLGLVDVMDIMKHCLNAYSEDDSGEAPAYTQWCQDPEKIRQRSVRYAVKPVRSLIGLSGINPACPVYETGDLYQLAEVFARGVRRVPVLNADEKLIQVVSQSTIVKYINEQREWLLSGVGSKSLEDLKLAHGPTVVSMHVKATAIQAYFLMLANKVSACAVVDGHNVLVGNLSASDLRDMSLADLPDLLLTCEEFLLKRSKQGETRPLVTCSPDTKLEECVRLLADHKVHRVWVVDEKKCPAGVVSLTDILRILVAPEESPMEE